MSISIEGKPGSGKTLFAGYLRKTKGIDYVDEYNERAPLGLPSCVVTQLPTTRTVRYLCSRNHFFRNRFNVTKLVYRRGEYIKVKHPNFFYDIKTKEFAPVSRFDFSYEYMQGIAILAICSAAVLAAVLSLQALPV